MNSEEWFIRMYGNMLKDEYVYVGNNKYLLSDLIKEAYEFGQKNPINNKDDNFYDERK